MVNWVWVKQSRLLLQQACCLNACLASCLWTHYDSFFNPTADCGAPPLPINGFPPAHTNTTEGSVVVFQCDPGFVPEGEIWQQCVGFPAQERSPVAPDPHRCSQRHLYWPQVLHAVDRIYWQLIRHPGFEFQQISAFCFRSSLFSNAQDFSCSYHWDPGVDSWWLLALFFSHNVKIIA